MHAAVRTRVRREPQIGGWVRASVLLGAGVGRGGVGGGAQRATGQGAWQVSGQARRTCLRKLVVRLQTARLICATRTTAASSCNTQYVHECPALP